MGVEKDSNFTCVYFVSGHSNHGIRVMLHAPAAARKKVLRPWCIHRRTSQTLKPKPHQISVIMISSAHLTFSVWVFVVLHVNHGVLFETADFDQGCTFEIRECKTEIPPCA